jgi:acetamidase/formamidase
MYAVENKIYDLPLKPENVHWGYYDPGLKPVLSIESGSTVQIETIVARGLQRLKDGGVPDEDIPDALKKIDLEVTERVGAHPLTGPIYIKDAEPGDTLAVRIINIEFLHPYGVAWFVPQLGTLPDDFPYTRFKVLPIDTKNNTANFGSGVTLKLAPFFGSIGVAPAAGRVPSGPPGTHAGNIDNKQLVAGSTLYIPVQVRGGLISFGDGHAIQGDGEVILSALETSLRGTVRIFLQKGKDLEWPHAETPTHYITMGMHPDLDEAARLATRQMVSFLVSRKGLSRDDAYFLCSMAVDLHVTQLVNGPKGVHAMVVKSIFR